MKGQLRNKAIIYLFLDPGFRLAELCGLRINQIDAEEGWAWFMGKGQKERRVPLHALAAAAIGDYVKHERPAPRDTDRLFLTADGRPLSARGMQSMLARLGREAGLKERLSPHKLRHTFATDALKYGGNLEYVRIILGHSNIKTTSDSYINADFRDIKDAHEKFSPLANLLPGTAAGKADLQKKGHAEGQQKDRERSEAGATGETSPDRNESRSTMQDSMEKPGMSASAAKETGAGERADADASGLRPFCRTRYDEHLRKLAVLAGELAADIENGTLERRRPPAKTGPNSSFGGVDLVGVFPRQNSRLWPFLAQHMDNEFVEPRLTKQIVDVAMDTVTNRLKQFMNTAR